MGTKRRSYLILPCLALFAIPARAEPPTVRALSLPAPVVPRGPQFIQADKAGRVFLLSGEDLNVFPVTARGLGSPTALKAKAYGLEVLEAVMGTDSGHWLLKSAGLHHFLNGEEVSIAAPLWFEESIGLVGDVPTITVRPIVRGSKPPPRISATRLSARRNAALGRQLGHPRQRRLEHPLVQHYAYRVRKFSPAGRVREELVLGKGEVNRLSDAAIADRQRAAMVGQASQQGVEATSAPARPVFSAMTAAPLIRAVTEGRDGHLYLLVNATSGGFALDRLDPVTKRMERVLLPFQYPGRMSMAAGREGLFFAPTKPSAGRWLVTEEELERAKWEPLKDLHIR